MKTITKTITYLQMTALLLTAALAGPGASEKEQPFHGSIQAVETSVLQFPTLFVDASGSGHATHLGRFTVTSEFEVNLMTLVGIGSAHFIAANGDSLFTEFIQLNAVVFNDARQNLANFVESLSRTQRALQLKLGWFSFKPSLEGPIIRIGFLSLQCNSLEVWNRWAPAGNAGSVDLMGC